MPSILGKIIFWLFCVNICSNTIHNKTHVVLHTFQEKKIYDEAIFYEFQVYIVLLSPQNT